MDPHVRYAALVARQLAAIRAEDLEEYTALVQERAAAAVDIESEPVTDPARAHAALAHAAELDSQILALMRERRDHLRARIRAEDTGRAPARAYARAAAPAMAAAFDVSL